MALSLARACITAALAALAALAPAAATAATYPVITVRGNHLIDGHGRIVRLLGVNRSGAEYACAQGWGFWDGPVDDASIRAMTSWGINAVRVPLNEACWLGLHSVKPALRGAAYQRQIRGFVNRLQQAGMYVILDLHWNAPGTRPALDQQQMADADHAPAFWRSVASAYQDDHGVLFDLYNEPHDISWRCWRDGCRLRSGWRTAGMRALLAAVRSTGATQPVLIGGLGWSGDLRGWWRWHPIDPDRALVAAFHTYGDGSCVGAPCWTASIAGVYRHVPLVTGELGEYDCQPTYVSGYMDWADARGISYLGWAWNVTTCSSGPDLISDYAGTPTPFGQAVHDHLLSLRQAGAV
jgi:endoglucanase